MKSILRTDVGRIRKANEDAAYASQGLYIVCDGMGGHQAGDVAANLAVDMLSSLLQKNTLSVRTLLSAIEKTNEHIYSRATAEKKLHGMGTTLTVLWYDKEQVLLGQVGDSRAYLLRDGVFRQCTHDHSMVAELVRMGSITQEEARVHPYRNLITRTVGTDSVVMPDIFEFARYGGDRWLLCSDGLTTHVTDNEMAGLLSGTSLPEAAQELLTLALERGGSDNITLVIADDEGGDSA